jgi:hypothetical protein
MKYLRFCYAIIQINFKDAIVFIKKETLFLSFNFEKCLDLKHII